MEEMKWVRRRWRRDVETVIKFRWTVLDAGMPRNESSLCQSLPDAEVPDRTSLDVVMEVLSCQRPRNEG